MSVREAMCPVPGCGNVVEMDHGDMPGLYRCPCRFRLLFLTHKGKLVEDRVVR
jgi:hypothetical protein